VKYRATLAYDGTDYQGFQRQAAGVPTIQAAVERALHQVTGQAVTVNGAGRTDAGVHATGQVIGFEVEWARESATLLRALNAVLPADIALQDLAYEPEASFHPRFSASSREYQYTVVQTPQRQPLMRQYAWHVRHELKLDAMQTAAALLLGEHDFATFGQPPQGDNTVRVVFRSEWQPLQAVQPALQMGGLIYTIEATAFLQHMVRRIVGMLVEVGRGALTVAAFKTSFESADLAQARTIAPPQGLVLTAVRYTRTTSTAARQPI
jgi:tRNA pseudouridine38-40 synthase